MAKLGPKVKVFPSTVYDPVPVLQSARTWTVPSARNVSVYLSGFGTVTFSTGVCVPCQFQVTSVKAACVVSARVKNSVAPLAISIISIRPPRFLYVLADIILCEKSDPREPGGHAIIVMAKGVNVRLFPSTL